MEIFEVNFEIKLSYCLLDRIELLEKIFYQKNISTFERFEAGIN